ncbi:MAG: flagellar protein FlgN [Bdellovibrionota bacterium]
MKQRSFEKLVTNLDAMIKQYRLLLDCVRKEKELLIKSNIEKLNESNALKEQILTEIKSLEPTRIICAIELAQLVGANFSEPRLLEIAQKIGGAEGDRLRTIHSTLELLTKRVVDINKDNAIYAESALGTVNSAMNNIKESLMGQKTYQKKGNYQPGYDKSGHLVSKEA